MAKLHFAKLEAMLHRYAFVENETFTVPFALCFRNIFQIAQNAAFQMIDLVYAFCLQKCG